MSLMTDMGTAVRTEILKRTYPTGAIAAFAMTTPPAGWLKCNGQQVSRTTYADLFTAIGTTFGVGNGTTTFTLPDLRGEFVRGFDDGRGVDAGRIFGSSQADELKSHIHTDVTVNGSIADNGDPGNYVVTAATQFQALTNVGGSVGATGGTETRPRNIALMWCVKAYGETVNEGLVDIAALANDVVDLANDVTDLASNTTKAGTVISFAATTAPTGYLKCNGALISRTTYATLFAAIGTTFGVGDGSTTFKLPDLRGEFIRGFDDARGIDTARVFGSAQADELKSHSHTLSVLPISNARYTSGGAGATQGTGYTSATGGTETRPRNIALLYCIKY